MRSFILFFGVWGQFGADLQLCLSHSEAFRTFPFLSGNAKKISRNWTVITPRKFTRKEALRFLTYVHLSATTSLADPLFPWQPRLIQCLCRHGRVPMPREDPRSSSASNDTRNLQTTGKLIGRHNLQLMLDAGNVENIK